MLGRLIRARQPDKALVSPGSTLAEEHWRALAMAYAAGDGGLDADVEYANIGPDAWLWLQMRDFENGALVVEEPGTWSCHPSRRCLTTWSRRITPDGCFLYKREWARYRELYPDVEAPAPATASRGLKFIC
jgi:hypothetical protein